MGEQQKVTAIYARVSTEEQTQGQVASLDTQVARCREKAAQLGLTVHEALIVQEQHSGADLRWEGTQFMGLVAPAERREFTDLICLDVSRFCRGGAEAYVEQKGYFTRAGVTVHYVTVDFGGKQNPFHASMEAIMADAMQFQRDQTREASLRNRHAWASAGNIVRGGRPTYGFRFVIDPVRVTRRNLPLVIGLEPDPATAPIVYEIIAGVANGCTMEAMCDRLDARNVPTPAGARLWQAQTIKRILDDPATFGARRSFYLRREERPEGSRRPAGVKNKWRTITAPRDEQYEVDPSRITPIPGVTEDLWRRAQLRIKDNKSFAPRNARLPESERAERGLLFSGVARCATCGCALTLVRRRNPDGWMYICKHRSTKYRNDRGVTMAARRLDAAVWEHAVQAMRDPTFLAQLIAETDSERGPIVRVAHLMRELTDLDAAREKLLRQLERLDPDDDLVAEYQQRIRANREQRVAVTDTLQQAQVKLAEVEARGDDQRLPRLCGGSTGERRGIE